MKKTVWLAIPGIALMAAGCGSGQSAVNTKTDTTLTKTVQTAPAGQGDSKTTVYTMDQVQTANTQDKCWTAVNGKVYDLTNFINKHPGGPKAVLGLCGKDGTAAFTKKHGGQPKPEQELAGLQIGVLK